MQGRFGWIYQKPILPTQIHDVVGACCKQALLQALSDFSTFDPYIEPRLLAEAEAKMEDRLAGVMACAPEHLFDYAPVALVVRLRFRRVVLLHRLLGGCAP